MRPVRDIVLSEQELVNSCFGTFLLDLGWLAGIKSVYERMSAEEKCWGHIKKGGIYGLGLVDYSDVLNMQVIGHGGSSLGYSAAVLYLPEYGVSIAWMINIGESPRELAGQVMFDIWSSLSDVVKENRDV